MMEDILPSPAAIHLIVIPTCNCFQHPIPFAAHCLWSSSLSSMNMFSYTLCIPIIISCNSFHIKSFESRTQSQFCTNKEIVVQFCKLLFCIHRSAAFWAVLWFGYWWASCWWYLQRMCFACQEIPQASVRQYSVLESCKQLSLLTYYYSSMLPEFIATFMKSGWAQKHLCGQFFKEN